MEYSSEPITFICPTRQRPANVIRLIESAVSNYSGKTKLNFMFYMDDDDMHTVKLVKAISVKDPNVKISVTVGGRIVMSEMSNILARKSDDGILFFCGDDIVMESKDWDLVVISEFDKVDDKILFVYGDDGLMHEKLATHSFIHKKWIETTGHFVPPIFTGDWADNYVDSVAEMLGRKVYVQNLKTTHYHPTAGKAIMDNVYLEKYRRDIKSNPSRVFRESAHMRELDVKKLKKFIHEKN
jgi:hypothetical protein